MAEKTKTSTTLERKVRHLPVVIPLMSFCEPCWVHQWLELRKQQGLIAAKGFPLLPSPVHRGGWAKVPLQVGAAGDWLRSLLKNHESRDGKYKIATHSCKTTLLSQAAKYGIDARSRRILGYHTASKDKSLVIYSRDEMSIPLRKLVGMVEAVKTHRFFPDRTRSGYLARAGDDDEGEQEEKKDDDPLSQESSSDTSDSGSEFDEDVVHEEEEAALDKLAGSWAPDVELGECIYIRHKTSRYLHLMLDEGGTHLRCGRTLNDRYTVLDSKPSFVHPACTACFKLGQKQSV